MSSSSSPSKHTDPTPASGEKKKKSTNNISVSEGLQAENPVKRDKHPKWYPPEQAGDFSSTATTNALSPWSAGLNVLNSLTETVEPFAPKNGRTVKWYTCGPTVYDVSHMGHARAYLTFDILRRIMEDYFGYSIQYQMNVTDIDDKIIKRARVNKLLEDFEQEVKGKIEELSKAVEEAVKLADKTLLEKIESLQQPLPSGTSKRIQDERQEQLEQLQLKKEQFAETQNKIKAAVEKQDAVALFKSASGPLGEFLDVQRGENVTDNTIFEKHAKKYEKAFFDDMDRLGIRQPDVISRVTEFVPQVVAYIEKIKDNGFAYVGETSVFFDTEAFQAAGHDYPKLKGGDKEATTEVEMAEGEGVLTKTSGSEKKHPNDFALWKFSKKGEPSWGSPWGGGRPGWHIECSVMASEILGENMDIHAGGWDLKFPHHDNELAQAEAYWCNHQWVNYFFHCGHLHIKGLKMSKSLKNFITIRQALDELGVTAREMRLLFLSTEWNKPMNFSDQSLGEAKERERVLRSFFGSLDIVFRQGDFLKNSQGFNEEDIALNKKWETTEEIVHKSLQNNFDTPTALTNIMSLVSHTNQYLLSKKRPNATLLRKVGRYITKILQVFGVVEGTDHIGLTSASTSASSSGEVSESQKLIGVMDSLVGFRDGIRKAVREKQPASALLPLCDEVRDVTLPPLGFRLEDKPDGSPTQWKQDDPAALLKEIEEKKSQQAEQAKTKIKNQIETKMKAYKKWVQFVDPPEVYFKDDESKKKYSEWDDQTGLPVKDKDGNALSDNQVKKLKKEMEKYATTHQELLGKGGAKFLKDSKDEIEGLEKQLK